MKRVTKKRLLAAVLSIAMVLGLMPQEFASSVAKAANLTVQYDLSNLATANKALVPMTIPSGSGSASGDASGDSQGTETTFGALTITSLTAQKETGTDNDAVDSIAALNSGIEATVTSAFVKLPNGTLNKTTSMPTVDGSKGGLKLEAAEDCNVKLAIKAGKQTVVVSAEGEFLYKNSNPGYAVIDVDLKAGTTYYVATGGGGLQIFAIQASCKVASDYQEHVIDLTQGLKAGTDYNGFSVVMDMPYTEDTEGNVTCDGITYDGYITNTTNPSPNKGAIPTTGAALVMTAGEKDTTFTVVYREQKSKATWLVDSDGNKIIAGVNGATDNYVTGTWTVPAGKSYYLYLQGSKIRFAYLMSATGTKEVEVDWSTVAAPVLSTPTQNEDGEIVVPYTAVIGDEGGEAIVVSMYKDGEKVESKTSKKKGDSGEVTFAPTASGTYTFTAVLTRDGETDKASNEVSIDYVLPLAKPEITAATNKGAGNVEVEWIEVPEATGYEVSYAAEGSEAYTVAATVTGLKTTITGLTVGTTYTVKVVALRGSDKSAAGTKNVLVKDVVETTWKFSAFGQGVALDTSGKAENGNGYIGDLNADGDVTVYSLGNKGKIVPADTDGLAFYYTEIPADKNFTLTAKVTVDKWTYTNGQEGFGLMACDAVGVNGDSSVFWNNSYMASITKVEYYWDAAAGEPSDAGTKYTMKLGIGSQEKTGVTPENLTVFKNDQTAALAQYYNTEMRTLETSVPSKNLVNALESSTFNIVGNYTNDVEEFTGTVVDNKTEFLLTIQKNNTGYFVSYTDEEGNTTTNKYYEPDALEYLDSDTVYVGFFASRACMATFSDVSLTTIDPADDLPAEERPIKLVTPSYKVISATNSNTEDYELVFYANADGYITVWQGGNELVTAAPVTAETKWTLATKLADDTATEFKIKFDPDPNYKPGEWKALSDYNTRWIDFTVFRKSYDKPCLYVAPGGSEYGTGAAEDPMDIYTAVKYVQPGQKIILMGGTYNLEKTVVVDRGIDGTEDALIYMVADPDSTERPVFDFGGLCAGMIFAGDYWYVQGFDVTNSANGQKGLQVSGSYCTFDDIHAYHNGNTGIQVSRYLGTDEWEDWPSNDLILNCTSYGNADAGYEDADGFAAKLTIADGIVFDGCIAYNNADDGWDLFAKPESGPIGQVIIRNCVAYGNGYLEDGTNAGNGNGFKMGGSSITGYHTIINSIAFNNKAKGIDSNSCPDIQVYNCTSFNNEGSNVALYTNGASKTDFYTEGLISYRTENLTVAENFKFKDGQVESKVYNATSYYWNGADASENVTGDKVSADWFVSTEFTGITRNADGTINMNGFLELTSAAPAGVGAVMGGKSSSVIGGIFNTPNPDDGSSVNVPTTEFNNELAGTITGTDQAVVSETVTTEGNIEPSVFEALKATGKILELKVQTPSGEVVAIISIDGKEITKTDVTFDLSMVVGASDSNVSAILANSKVDEQKAVLVDFSYSGELPGPMTISLNVARRFNNGANIALFYVNPKTNALENQSQTSVVNNGYVTFKFTHFSQYVMIETAAAGDAGSAAGTDVVKTGDNTNVLLYVLISVVACSGIGATYVMGRKREEM